MGVAVHQIMSRLGTRGIAAAAAVLIVFAAVAATPQLLGTHVAAAFSSLDGADPKWLWVAGIGFAVSVMSSAASWRSAIATCGGRLSLRHASARYGVGCLGNTFVPARGGGPLQPLRAGPGRGRRSHRPLLAGAAKLRPPLDNRRRIRRPRRRAGR